MSYSIPTTFQEILALRQAPASPETLARAMAGVVHLARQRGQSLEDLKAEVLMEDNVLDAQQRSWLWDMLQTVWHRLPS
jgi:hypothetical protein